MTTFLSNAPVQGTGAQQLQKTQAQVAEANQLTDEAAQDALWRLAQNNAMAKLRGYNSLAKSANDMA